LALAGAVLLALAGQAHASRFTLGDFQYAKDSANLPPAGSDETTSSEVSPRCGSGWKIVGGGGNPRGLAGHTRLTATGFGGKARWEAEATHLDAPKTKFTGYSVCVQDRFVDDATHLVSVTAGPTTAGGEVSCPSGLAAIGGGVRAIGDPLDWALNTTYPIDLGTDADSIPDDGWRDYMFYGGGSSSSFLVDVACGEDVPDYRSKVRALDIAATDGVRAKVMCHSGHVTGGGALISGAVDQAYIVASYPIDGKDHDKAPDDGWKVFALNFEGADKTLTTYAICL
jgi:hypothetical protein